MLSHHSLLAGYARARPSCRCRPVRFWPVMRLGSIGVLGTSYFFPLTLEHTHRAPGVSLATAVRSGRTVEDERSSSFASRRSCTCSIEQGRPRPGRSISCVQPRRADLERGYGELPIPVWGTATEPVRTRRDLVRVFLGDRDDRAGTSSSKGAGGGRALLSSEGRGSRRPGRRRLQSAAADVAGYWRTRSDCRAVRPRLARYRDIAFRTSTSYFIHGRTRKS